MSWTLDDGTFSLEVTVPASTTAEVHAVIRANLHRAPMYSGQIESVDPAGQVGASAKRARSLLARGVVAWSGVEER